MKRGRFQRALIRYVLVTGVTAASAMETDPFLALTAEISDSSAAFDGHVNEVLERRLGEFNQRHRGARNPATCEDAVVFALEGFRRPLFSRIAHCRAPDIAKDFSGLWL